MKFMILIFILAHAKAYAKINQPTTDMSIVISTESVTENKCSDFVATLDTNDATDYYIQGRNRCFFQAWLQTTILISDISFFLF